jgi:hypothetical protein
MEFEFIDENEIEAVRRGRKSNVSAELVEAFRTMPKGKAVKVKGLSVDPKSEDFKNDKATASATIRTAGRLAGVKVSISWSPEGIPQVTTKVAKAAKVK